MKVFLHIGGEKTGTTSVQAYLAKNRDFFARNGIVSPRGILKPGWTNNLELPLAAKERVGTDIEVFRHCDYGSYRKDVERKLQSILGDATKEGARAVVFSSEHLSSRLIHNTDVEALKGLFPADTEFTIIVYLRAQSALYLGALAEGIKAGATSVSFRNPLDAGDVPYGVRYYDYRKMLEPWEAVFGQESIVVRVYERGGLEQGDVVRDFIRAIGVNGEIPDIEKGSRLNSRRSPEFLTFLALLNPLIDDDLRRLLVKNSEMIDSFSRGSLISVEDLGRLSESVAESNADVAMRYLSRDVLFRETEKMERYFDGANVWLDAREHFLPLVVNALKVAAASAQSNG